VRRFDFQLAFGVAAIEGVFAAAAPERGRALSITRKGESPQMGGVLPRGLGPRILIASGGAHLISQRLLSSAAVTDSQRDMPGFRRLDLSSLIHGRPWAGRLSCFRLSALHRSITRKEAASC
jgi:hypothetical protein